MTGHLSPDDVIAAADGSLDGVARAHVDGCPTCRAAVDEAAEFLGRVRTTPVPEPSPLFWDHFSARVRRATTEAPAEPVARWMPDVRAWSSLLAAAATVVFAVWVVRQPSPTPVVAPDTQPVEVSADAASDDQLLLDTMTQLSAEGDVDHLLDDSSSGAGVAAIDELSAAERVVFARLLIEADGDQP